MVYLLLHALVWFSTELFIFIFLSSKRKSRVRRRQNQHLPLALFCSRDMHKFVSGASCEIIIIDMRIPKKNRMTRVTCAVSRTLNYSHMEFSCRQVWFSPPLTNHPIRHQSLEALISFFCPLNKTCKGDRFFIIILIGYEGVLTMTETVRYVQIPIFFMQIRENILLCKNAARQHLCCA